MKHRNSIIQASRESRDLTASIAAADKKANAKHPIYAYNHQQQILGRIKQTLSPLYEIYFKLALETGERTTDLANVQYSNFTFHDDGTATMDIIVAKQTKSAEKRAINKVLRRWLHDMKEEAADVNDQERRSQLKRIKDLGEVEYFVPDSEIDIFTDEIVTAINGAAIKRSSKKVSASLVTLIKEQQERNIFDDFLFSTRLMNKSNKTSSASQPVSRKTIWAKFKGVFTWFEDMAKTGLKLSAYSLRKTFAINKFNDAKKKGEDGTAAVCELFGHADRATTRHYLLLGNIADEPISI